MTHRRDVIKSGATIGVGMGVLGTGLGSAQTTKRVTGNPSFSTSEMTGDNQPKNVTTNANGVAMFAQAGENVRYALLVSKLKNVTKAHIHIEQKGQSGRSEERRVGKEC